MKGTFQIILIVVFIAAAAFGVLVFSGVLPIGGASTSGGTGTVVAWGTVKTTAISQAIEEFNAANPDFTVKYVEKSAETFDQDLLEALAAGTGPDMFFLPDNLAYHYANKITTIPYSSYSLANFQQTFAGAGEVFLNSSGMIAFPMAIDPLVMYYSRSILDANAVVYPPDTWDKLLELTTLLTKKDDANKILKSTVALGHFSNIDYAKDIITALFMQAGNPVLAYKAGILQPVLSDVSATTGGLGPVLSFYTQFADPNSTAYSWNRSFPDSRTAFSKEDLTFYFGYGSELSSLVSQNPNQNFSLAPFPQLGGAAFKLTGAHVMGLAISSSSKNKNTAYIAASLMAGGDFANKFRVAVGAAPARRDLLVQKPNDTFSSIMYDSALYARTWLDPSPKDTDGIFRNMVESVLSNTATVDNAIRDANTKLSLLLAR